MSSNSGFKNELTRLLNIHSRENKSNTPDYILANYLLNCLNAFEKAVNSRDEHKYGKEFKETNNEEIIEDYWGNLHCSVCGCQLYERVCINQKCPTRFEGTTKRCQIE